MPSSPLPPKKRRGRPSKAEVEARQREGESPLTDADASEGGAVKEAAPAKRGRKRKEPKEEAEDDDGDAATSAKPKRGKRAATKKTKKEDEDVATDPATDATATEPELDSDGEPIRRAKNGRRLPKKKPKPPKVYVIPDVEKRDFRAEYRPGSGAHEPCSAAARSGGFTGRLGYACLNTVLRTADPPVFSSRTARIKSIEEKGLDWVKDLARQNARDIVPMLRWNAANHIRFMRLSSEIFPFASHKIYGYDPACAAEELAEAGRVARELNHRVTMHPGQFCQLGSPNPAVVEASIAELRVHAAVLDLMGMDQDSVMILHGGGVYQDRSATLARMRTTIRDKLPANVRARLVLENDEISWSAEELLPVCREFLIPMVFDFHHDMLRPSAQSPRELMPELLSLFSQRGIKPKFHLSHPRPGSRNLRERRAHSDRCGWLPLDLPPDADLMIEAKDKEQAVLELYRVYGLHPVAHDALRPPADDITTATSGRRKVLNGSGGAEPEGEASAAGKDGEDEKPKGKPKARKLTDKQLESEKVRRSIEHSKRIAAKRGVPYTGPEYVDPAMHAHLRRLEDGPILGIGETVREMEREADVLRAELRRRRGQGGADGGQGEGMEGEDEVRKRWREASVGAVRAEVEEKLGPNLDGTGEGKGEGEGKGKGNPKPDGSDAALVPPAERMADPSEHTRPGEEERVVL